MGKINSFFESLSISPWASFAIWLHLEALLEIIKNFNKFWLSNVELDLTHTISKLDVHTIATKHIMPFITSYLKKFKKSLKFTPKVSRTSP